MTEGGVSHVCIHAHVLVLYMQHITRVWVCGCVGGVGVWGVWVCGGCGCVDIIHVSIYYPCVDV